MQPQRRQRGVENNNNNNNNTKNSNNSESTAAEKIHHFPSTSTFPTEVIVDSDFPALPYSTRRGAVKSIIHWGQRKLLLSEIQLFIEAIETRKSKNNNNTNNAKREKFTIVYPGSAPGTHLPYLDKLFPGNEWILIDPISFNPKLAPLKNFRLINGYFTAETCLSLIGERLIRNGRPALARVVTFAATGGEDSTVYPLNERVLEAEEGANLIKGVKEVDLLHHQADAAITEAQEDNKNNDDSAQDATKKAEIISSFLRNTKTSGLNLLVSVAMSSSSSSSSPSTSMGEMLFVSDIRSGTSTLTEDNAAEPDKLGAEFESHIMNDMRVQMEWVEMVRPSFAMLKFRLPYMEVYDPISKKIIHHHPQTHTEYLGGKVLLPIWTRPTSTECRLLVPEGVGRIQYDNRKFENQLFFFNTVLRENVHFEHLIEGDDTRQSFLDHRYDGAAEVNLLLRYLKIKIPDFETKFTIKQQQDEVLKLSREITENLGKPFEHAASRLNELALEKAKARGFYEVQQKIVQKCEEKRAMDVWWRNQENKSNEDDDDQKNQQKSMWSWYYSASN